MKDQTIAIHAGFKSDSATKSVSVPIYQTVAYEFDSAQHGADLFNLEVEILDSLEAVFILLSDGFENYVRHWATDYALDVTSATRRQGLFGRSTNITNRAVGRFCRVPTRSGVL